MGKPSGSPGIGVAGVAAASVNGGPGPVLPETRYFELDSEAVGDRFGIWVTLPPGYRPGATFPVVYVLDGNTCATVAAAAFHLLLGDHLRPMRRFVQVGIGYPDDDVGDRWIRRNRDFLPPGEPYPDFMERHIRGKAYASVLGEKRIEVFLDQARNGRADRFLDFIETELHPRIVSAYAVDSSSVGLFGHSQGGLLALFALVCGRTLFRTIGAASPAISTDDSEIFRLYRLLAGQRTMSTDFVTRLHMVVNDLEMTGDIAPYRALGRGFLRFVDTVRSMPLAGLDMTTEVIVGETHFSGVFDAYRSFLRHCYAKAKR